MRDQYQKTYENKIGKAKLDIVRAVVGTRINCRLIYRVGELGIDDSGAIKVLLRIVSDAAELQFGDEKGDNYVKISCSKPTVKLVPAGRSTGLLGKVHPRPWSRGFVLNVSGDYLADGDKVVLEFVRWRIQTFAEKKFGLKLAVDPFATGRFIEMPDYPALAIVADKPERLVVVAPTKVRVGKKFEVLMRLEDKWGNPCEVRHEVVEAKYEGVMRLERKWKELRAVSNPIMVVKRLDYGQFWADFHGQTGETVGTGSVEEYFEFARDYAGLDMTSIQSNDFEVTNEFWEKIQKTTKKFNAPGEFLAFPGYEWSGNTGNGGDRNVIYESEGMPIYRSSHASLADFGDVNDDAATVRDLFVKLDPKKTVVMAHVGGRFANLQWHKEELETAVEVHSDWGTFEWLVLEALKKSYKMGIVAGSDGHDGKPGASYPGLGHFNVYGGLTCVMARELTRESVFEALKQRRTYATTGIRAYLDTRVEGNNLRVTYSGTDSVDRIELWSGDGQIYRYYPKMSKAKGKAIKIVWSGSKAKGRSREMHWDGKAEFTGVKVMGIETINFFNRQNLVTCQGNVVEWNSGTTGNVQGAIARLTNDGGTLKLKVNDKEVKLAIGDIDQQGKSWNMGGLDAKLEVYETSLDSGVKDIEFEYKLVEFPWVFVKVIQRDGNLVWSSPLWLHQA